MSRTSRRSSSGATSVASFVKNVNDEPVPMTSTERLQHIRNSITRLKYVLEKAHHTEHLSHDDSNEGGALHFLKKLAKRISYFEHHPGKVGTTETGPQSKTWLEEEVSKHLSRGQAVLSPADAESDSILNGGSVSYQNLNLHHVQECVNELNELHLLLTNKQLASRVSVELLKDQISFHIEDFDYLLDNRIHQYISENLREGACYTSPIPDTAPSKPPVGLCSVELLDVAVGVNPARVANAVLDHLDAKIAILRNRLSTALDSIQHSASSPDMQILQGRQKREYIIMKNRIEDAKQSSETLRARWLSEEDAFLDKVRTGTHTDLKELADAKKIKELEIAEAAARSHDDMCYRCLPFVSPQYCRRYALTYSNPCQIRIGIRVFNNERKSFIAVPNTCPHYFQYVSKHPAIAFDSEAQGALDYLIPSQYKLWIPFDEFPEMVMGKRCALRDTDNRVDHERAMEEHKEVGAYFLMKGGERILRALLMQRCNVPINIHRERFASQGPNFAPNAVVIRSKRPSGLTVQNYFYYSTVGEVLFSFARKVVWHVPVSLLLFCLKPGLTPLNLFQLLTAGVDGSPSHEPRVEAFLQFHRSKPYGLLTNHLDYLSVLGRMYRQYQQSSSAFRFIPDLHPEIECHHDAWYGLFMLRRHVMPHLNSDAATPPLPISTSDFSAWPGEAIQDELLAKFHVMTATTRQLYSFIDGKTAHQGNDVPSYQEVFTSSQVLVGAFEVCLNRALRMFSYRMGTHLNAGLLKDITSLVNCGSVETSRVNGITTQIRRLSDYCCARMGNGAMASMHKLLITGNFVVDREEDFYCPQQSGWVVMAEHLNFFRFFEQLKCLHRGKTIADMRSSDVRKYPPEAYGFICMVHSPDGEDCGVLNHMSISTIVASSMQQHDYLKLQKWIDEACPNLRYHTDTSITDRFHATVPLWVEGNVIGYLTEKEAASATEYLRDKKSLKDAASVTLSGLVLRRKVKPLNTIEIVNIPRGGKDPAGLYIFAENGRLMRPICKIESNSVPSATSGKLPFPIPFVGTWEQTWLDIASVPSDLNDADRQLKKKYEYMEQNGSNLISFTSCTIPFFEHNCSPRNLFQCGLSKQSAGTQLQALGWRKEAKLFRVYTPQRSIVRTLPMDYFGLDDVSLGVNATIAILSYTGYDMDDAVIVNSTAVQRGFLHAGITIAKVIKAAKETYGPKKDTDGVMVFNNVTSDGTLFSNDVDDRGLPLRRARPESVTFERDHSFPTLRDENIIYCTAKRFKRVDPETNTVTYEYTRHHAAKWKSMDKGEAAFVQNVVPLEFDGPDVVSALVVFRIPRNPAVGDKFSSRHGQKGTLPLHIKAMDLPFIAHSGITPDVIINPHAFPSRMTVGMVLEILGAKLGAIEGRFMDHSAWSVVDNQPRGAALLGDALASNGYQRYGRERMICGMSGVEMAADVFTGVSGYQRLRHMVSDKWQARSRTDTHTHRAVTKTGQPVKGRKRHGGVRIGEMERDGLLSHGIAEVVIDRLLNVSDKTKAFICSECGSMLSVYEKHTTRFSTWKSCKLCSAGEDESTDTIKIIDIPQVFRLWVTELASIGVRVTLSTK